MREQQSPTLADVRAWPATCDVEDAGRALGISRSTAYELVRLGEFPARTIKAGARIRVLTVSLLTVLSGEAA